MTLDPHPQDPWLTCASWDDELNFDIFTDEEHHSARPGDVSNAGGDADEEASIIILIKGRSFLVMGP